MVVGEVYACSFPAAIQDALSAHLYLISSGVDARDIVLSGDSADANIDMYIKQVTTPGGAILWSPWFDIAGARNDPGRVYRHRNAASDYITGECREYGAKTIDTEEDVRSPYLTPLGHPFACGTPYSIRLGGAEMLTDEQSQSAQEMGNVPGNQIGSWTEDDANHDILKAGIIMGFGEHVVLCKQSSRFLG